ncbi:hypothetical protein E1162_16535 [Rhodobacteraceae bacterium RKSG542]|uniref:hypothetical protein n=1 Tax=Pseudovibrio flavus TaxID=2529854 RepID=UPI0012BB9C10|nr:hypothetical protein [Pseudovibrio flavus]MTI18853.1 hypothetical protein [Pseudovibrio flavus]
MSNDISWILACKPLIREADRFSALMGELTASVQTNEPETHSYVWYLAPDGSRCEIYASFTGNAGALFHLNRLKEDGIEPFRKVLEPTSLAVYGHASRELKGLLHELFLPPVLLQTVGGFVRP